jgi:hypothetical protein
VFAPPTWAETTAQRRLVTAARATWLGAGADDSRAARGRIGAHVVRGLEILSEELFATDADRAAIDLCRQRALERPALNFLYRLPQSAGFGAAVGRAFHDAVVPGGAGVNMAERVSALVGAYMTVVDGLVDCLFLPDETLAALGAELVTLAAGRTPDTEPEPPQDADSARLVALARQVAAHWISFARAAVPADHPLLPSWQDAVANAWQAERASATGMLADGVNPSTAPWRHALAARTVAPHRLQMLTALMASGHRADPETRAALDSVVNAVADLAAWLDDICDLDEDLAEGRWNTVTAAMHDRVALPLSDPAETRLAIAVRLSFDHEVAIVMAEGEAIRRRLDCALDTDLLDPSLLCPLVEDMVTAYLAVP